MSGTKLAAPTRTGRRFGARVVRAAVAAAVACIALALAPATAVADTPRIKIGSKRFTESYVLAEIVTQLARAQGIDAVHERGLGATAVTYRALVDGAIDAYVEYTGTLAEAVIRGSSNDEASIRAALAADGLQVSEPLGFENTYALGVPAALASRLGLRAISDLAAHPELRVGVSHEFMGRRDGWPNLRARYGLRPAGEVSALDHSLAYEAVKDGTVDVVDVYTTDAKIARYDLTVLVDDAHFFPRYDAVLLYRADLLERAPAFSRVIAALEGAIDAETMRRLNARAELDGLAFPDVAREFLGQKLGQDLGTTAAPESFTLGLWRAVRRHGPRHLALVAAAVLSSTLVGVPLGVLAHRRRRVGALVLGVTGIVQTIPSLALFCFFIPLLGIGPVPALAALFLYGLLPIVQSTTAGLASIAPELSDAAIALGLSPRERMVHVEMPLASRMIVAGIKTSAVVAVGNATIAAFIGAGGFGVPISTGLSLNDVRRILFGAIPAAALALAVQGAFALLERIVVPRGIRDGA